MAMTSSQLRALLEEEELRFSTDQDNTFFMVPFERCTVRLRLIEDGKGLVAHVPDAFNLTDTPHLEACLAFIGHHNYQVKLGILGYDPRDGEVDISDFVPIQEGTLVRGQVARVVRVLVSVAHTAIPQLRRLAMTGQLDDSVPEGRPPSEAARALAAVADSVSESSLPTEPVCETDWLDLCVNAFGLLTADVENEAALAKLRSGFWPRLQALRETSIAAGHPYLLPTAVAAAGLGAAEEFVVLFMAARQAANDTRISYKELDLVFSPGIQVPETIALGDRLMKAGVIVAVDGDSAQPFKLAHSFLDPLVAVLPFEWEPLPPIYAATSVPAGPVAETDWLAEVYAALQADAADVSLPDRLAMLQDEVWPALLALRQRSVEAGHRYATVDQRAALRLDDREELVVAYVAQRADRGETRVDLPSLDQVHSVGLDRATVGIVQTLEAAGALASSDGDHASPFTLGAAATAWSRA